MNELRWILLAAGLLLIAGIYVWGLRTRSRNARGAGVETRPAVFTGGASGFERAEAPPVDAAGESDEDPRLSVPAAARRVEPSLSLDEEDMEAGERDVDAGIDFDEDMAPAPATLGARREPTLSVHPQPHAIARAEPTLRPRATPPAVEIPAPAVGPAASSPADSPATTTAAAAAKPQRPAQKIFAVRVSAIPGARFEGTELLEALRAEGLGFGRYDIFHRLHSDGRPVFSVASLREPGTFDLQSMPTTQYPGIALFTVVPGPVTAGEAYDEMLLTARTLATHLNGALADEKGVPLTATRVARLREDVLEFERAAGPA